MYLPTLFLFTLLPALAKSQDEICWAPGTPGGFGISFPNKTSTLLANHEYTITYDADVPAANDWLPALNKGNGLMYLQLYQYIAPPGHKCRTNFSEPILWVAKGTPNTGTVKWKVPANLEINDNFIISGNIYWKEKTLIVGYQSDQFSIKHQESDVIPESEEIKQAISWSIAQASASASSASALSEYFATHTRVSSPEPTSIPSSAVKLQSSALLLLLLGVRLVLCLG